MSDILQLKANLLAYPLSHAPTHPLTHSPSHPLTHLLPPSLTMMPYDDS